MEVESDADAHFVAALGGVTEAVAHRRIDEATREGGLFRYIAGQHAREGRRSYIEIDAPLELYALVRILRPRHVVEVGVSSGVSSGYLLEGLQRNRRGTLHSIDLPSFPPRSSTGTRTSAGSWTLPPGRTSGWAVPPSLRPRWDLRLGDKRDVLPRLAEQVPEIDLVVYDVPHEDTASFAEFRALDRRMSAGSVAIVDHGSSGDLCAALARWGRLRSAVPVRRSGLGLYGIRLGPRRRGWA